MSDPEFENAVRYFDGSSGEIAVKKIVVAVSSYNRPITEQLLIGALTTLQQNGIAEEAIDVLWVPGAWELAVAAKTVIASADAVICLGAVIKGDTTHDQYINSMISQTLGEMSVEHGKPIGFGVLTCNTVEQAIDRSGGKVGNKGDEAANAVIEMLRLLANWKRAQ